MARQGMGAISLCIEHEPKLMYSNIFKIIDQSQEPPSALHFRFISFKYFGEIDVSPTFRVPFFWFFSLFFFLKYYLILFFNEFWGKK